ncbi:Uncharacterized conserved protein YkwD, contains CAP (CSP/antigen 5/PR1) domain [Palleronia marisminoris]|uniref:Cysteine-rich secretory protein family protein n=1 Tax=Palleronia marisminoris TaxID=315423 RepID=A0A1Y5TH63_9RHOB|nr:CAP domain-containing protein [Palleronia marisminoris]SFH39364.1 Uncharacterized conserved protein YkwD, contains CAP (CSP/antigen 5/PR1) domain [Palleronia marisminoris]SLN64135.1 Cysteine-rich secretory protein family protein [Palleronia marisminoris]
MTGLTALRSLALAALCATALPAAAQDAGDLDALRQRALELVNTSRSEAGLPELSLGPILNEAAQSHAVDMVERDYYAHVGPDGQTPADRFLAAGGSQWALSGENIAMCSGCMPPPDIERIEAFHEGWMQSPEHRENILTGGFDRFGFGVAGEADEIYAVQTFAGPGEDDDAPALTAEEAHAAALAEMNAHRESAGLGPLDPSEPLSTVAERVLEARLADEEPPKDIFGLLPEGETGWTSLSILSASRGGSGVALSKEDVAAFVEGWASGNAGASLGGERATHLGFAAATRDDGRATAVAVFGGRD